MTKKSQVQPPKKSNTLAPPSGKTRVNPALVARHARVRKRLVSAATKPAETLLIQYDVDLQGMDEEDVEDNRDQYGENAITQEKQQTVFHRLFDAFVNPFTVVLFVLAIISLFTDYVLVKTGDRTLATPIIVASLVAISGLLRFFQEQRSSNAAEKLSEMVATTVAVQRIIEEEDDEEPVSRRVELPLDELVVGDIVYLAAGDMIPADVRILQARDLFVSQAALTGESEPVEKTADPIAGKHFNPLDLANLAFMGSNVISGTAVALVLAVGDDTHLGGISRQLQGKKEKTSFDKGINSVSWVLIRFMLVMVPIVLLVNGFTKGDWPQALLFALSVAVGLTPEMLPMIVTTNLAKGAVSMSRKKVIVKDLSAIQNFGAMDVLCVDKTGTITQDRIILEYHINIHGDEDERVLRYAFLNSYYQTGLKNLMDLSIIEHARARQLDDLWRDYQKLDELPFDFQRRRMSVVVKRPSGRSQLITKGAIEEMLALCSHAEYQGEVTPLTDEIRAEIREQCGQYNADGLRVLAVAKKQLGPGQDHLTVEDEADMVLIGYLAFLDPPKESTAEALAALHQAGVRVKVLTGDNDGVTRCVCKQVGLPVERVLLGADVEAMDDDALRNAVDDVDVFAKLSPAQKARIVTALRDNGHTVGFMGDGINDAQAMKASDIGISVDTAVDIAKESADIILLEKDLMVLDEGVIEGRKIYANIIKYIKMTASSNFGNMLSVLVASFALDFLPMLPLQILVLNLIYDISCIAIPWDNVDRDYLLKPRSWDASSITKFMVWIGPVSSIFDITTFALMYFVIAPLVGSTNSPLFISVFTTGWFVESLWSQTLVVHMIRTPKLPFLQSRASWQLTGMTLLGIAIGTALPYIPTLNTMLEMTPLPALYWPILAGTILLYMMLATVVKKLFVRKHGELL